MPQPFCFCKELSSIDIETDISIWVEIRISINLNFYTNQWHYQTNGKIVNQWGISKYFFLLFSCCNGHRLNFNSQFFTLVAIYRLDVADITHLNFVIFISFMGTFFVTGLYCIENVH